MGSDLLILGFDTSAAHCAVALLRGDEIVVARSEEMTRGQVERLMPLLEEVLAEGGATWADLDRIGVGVGPGNFTGIRIAVSAARGLALALEVPAVGVSTFEAISLECNEGCAAVVPAPRDQVYVQFCGQGPRLAMGDEVRGAGVDLAMPPKPHRLAENIARIAAGRSVAGMAPPAPLYIKPADAAPSRHAPPVMLDDNA